MNRSPSHLSCVLLPPKNTLPTEYARYLPPWTPIKCITVLVFSNLWRFRSFQFIFGNSFNNFFSVIMIIIIIIITLTSQPQSHFSRLLLKHWVPLMSRRLTSSASWDAGSPLSACRRSDRPPIFSRGCQSLCSDSMQSFFTTAFHQVRTSGHQWISF